MNKQEDAGKDASKEQEKYEIECHCEVFKF